MARARGANALMDVGFEDSYGVPRLSGYVRHPFVSISLGEDQPLVPSDLLGAGREPQEPSRGEANDTGDVVVPLCARNFGDWLKMLLGAPATVQGLAAGGAIVFAAQPEANATISIAGTAFTFVSGTPTGNQIRLGGTLPQTVANAVRALNASAVAAVKAAAYRAGVKGASIEILHGTVGVVGNSLALAASTTPNANATLSGATLTGGAATGGYRHTFTSGAQTLPSGSIQVGHPDVPAFSTNYGVKANTAAITLARAGNLNATIGLIAQGETPISATSQTGAPVERAVLRFSHFSGLVLRAGVPIADLVAGSINIGTGLDPVPSVGRGDGRIGGVDEGSFTVTGSNGIRFSTTEFQQQAESGEGIDQEYSWSIPGQPWSLRFIVHRVFLPRAKRPVTAAGGIQADYNWQAARAPATGRSLTVVLVNDVESY